MERNFTDVLSELGELYATLEQANAVLELEVTELRGKRNKFETCQLTVPSDYGVGTLFREAALSLEETTNLEIENSISQVPQLINDSVACIDYENITLEHGNAVCLLTPLCDRMQVLVARMEARYDKEKVVPHGGHPKSAEDYHSNKRSSVRASVKHASSESKLLTRKLESAEQIVMGEKAELSRDFSVKWDGFQKISLKRASSLGIEVRKVIPCTQKHFLDVLGGITIVTYCAFIGFEAEIASHGHRRFDDIFFRAHMVFNTYFFLELLARLGIFGWREFLTGRDVRLNVIDVLLALSAIIDIVVGSDSLVAARALRSIRVARLIRTVRIFNAMGNIREFQKMIFAITSSVTTLGYAILILFAILYFFSVIFVYGSIEAREYYAGTEYHDDDLERFWGTLFSAIYSCFISIAAGQSWADVIKPLSVYSNSFTYVFVGFILLTLFGVLNAITAIFVESAMLSAQRHKEMVILDKEHANEMYVNHIKSVFQQMDEDGSGEINARELEFFLSHESLRKYMEALHISIDDTRMLFRLLDTDGSGTISIDEFCKGCLRLKGEARAYDLQVLALQMRAFMDKWSDFTRFAGDLLNKVDERTTVICSINNGVGTVEEDAGNSLEVDGYAPQAGGENQYPPMHPQYG